VIVVLFTFYFE